MSYDAFAVLIVAAVIAHTAVVLVISRWSFVAGIVVSSEKSFTRPRSPPMEAPSHPWVDCLF